VPKEAQFSNSSLPHIGRQRLLISALQAGSTEYTVVLMAPLDEIDRSLGQLLAVLFTAIPICLVVAGGLAYLQARKALAPMWHLHRLTEQITADRLDRRLPVPYREDELGRLTQTINAMVARLERSFGEIRRFTADASHEIRTPLTAIRSAAEVALGRSLSMEDHRQLLGSILEECERLTRLTDQLLTLSREDAGQRQVATEKIELGGLIQTVMETIRPAADAKRVRLKHSENGQVAVSGDRARIRQVLYNLLDNAIKYTPEGGEIEVTLGRADGTAKVTVRDTGIGISGEHIAHVFDRFYRVDKAGSRE